MKSFWINSMAAQLLKDENGFMYSQLYPETPLTGKFTIANWSTRRLGRLHTMERIPRLQLSHNDVRELMLLPNDDVRDALLTHWEASLPPAEALW